MTDAKPAIEPQSWEGPELEFENGIVPGVPLLFQATKIGGVPVGRIEETDNPLANGLFDFAVSFSPADPTSNPKEPRMSQFGDGTFEQAMLDWIEGERQSHAKSTLETVAALARILAHLAGRGD